MKRFLKIIGLLFFLLAAYVLYVLFTTGSFRTIENTYTGDMAKVMVPGAEDFAISREDGFLMISSDDRAARRDGRPYKSGLYYMDLNDGKNKAVFIQAANDVPLFPHGISMIKIDSSTYRLLVINHVTSSAEAVSSMDPTTKHSIEEYIWRDSVLTFVQSFTDDLIYSPNDVVAIDKNRFYFTNDHGSHTKLGLMAEDYLGLKRSNVVYYDGSNYKMVDDGIAYANGINYDNHRSLLYVASPRGMLIKVYDTKDDGSLTFQTDVDCNTGVDNIEIDESGKIWIGCHPKLLDFGPYALGKKEFSPSEIITIDYKNKDDYKVESVFMSNGETMSASTTAIPYKGKVYLGNVMDKHFLVLDADALE